MNWYLFFGTWIAGGVAVAGWMWQLKHEEPKDEFPLQKMRKHLGIVPQGAPKDWTESWVDGEDKPLKVQPLLPPKQDTGPFKVGFLESLLEPTGDQDAAFLRGIERARIDRAAKAGWEPEQDWLERTGGHGRLQ